MGNNFFVKHGGMVRYSTAVSASETTYWNKGRVLGVDTSGQWRVHTGNNTTYPNAGIAMETRVNASSVTSPTVTVYKIGAPTGDVLSAIMDPAVIVNDELESGIAFTAGALLYIAADGEVTTSGNSSGPSSPPIGAALSYANAGDPGKLLTMFFQFNY